MDVGRRCVQVHLMSYSIDTESPVELETPYFDLAGDLGQQALRDPCLSQQPVLGLQACTVMSIVYVDAGYSDSDTHACRINSFTNRAISLAITPRPSD